MKTKMFLKFFAVCLFLNIALNTCTAQVSQQWVKYYNSPTNGSDIAKAMAVDNAGNIYITGPSPASTTGIDFATIKYNSGGVQQWAARYNRLGNLDDYPSGIAVDYAGNVYITGASNLGPAYSVLTIVKYNSAGVQQWAARKGDTIISSSPAGFKSPIGLDNSGNIYVGGSTRISATENGCYLLIKYNSNGDSLWSKTYDGTSFLAGLGSGVSAIKVAGNYVYVTGKSFDMNPSLAFATTIKYDLNGNSEWTRKDTLTSGSDQVTGMDIDPSGNIIIICNYGLNIVTFKYSSFGERLWKTIYTGIPGDHYDEVTGVAADISGNIFITGNSDRSASDRDFLTLKYDANGNQLWEKLFNGTGNDGDYSHGIQADNAGNCYITGTVYQTGFHTDIATIKYNSGGVQQWIISFDGGYPNRNDDANAIGLDSSGNVIVAGVSNQPAGHNDDFAVIKYSQSTGIKQLSSQIPDAFSLSQNYPNPFNPVTTISYRLTEGNFTSLKIYNCLGKETATLIDEKQNAGTYSVSWDAADFPSGVYFYTLTSGNFVQAMKMNLIK